MNKEDIFGCGSERETMGLFLFFSFFFGIIVGLLVYLVWEFKSFSLVERVL